MMFVKWKSTWCVLSTNLTRGDSMRFSFFWAFNLARNNAFFLACASMFLLLGREVWCIGNQLTKETNFVKKTQHPKPSWINNLPLPQKKKKRFAIATSIFVPHWFFFGEWFKTNSEPTSNHFKTSLTSENRLRIGSNCLKPIQS